jgi:hypothetical protein
MTVMVTSSEEEKGREGERAGRRVAQPGTISRATARRPWWRRVGSV